ncbi:Glyco-hydro-cc domain-containing protein [Mycena indigotica]|uniref:Glyco-hydro-cc domain-containing protein n=1 Tax=Mycena indigotica TaxID=2126181 RepID=A0A8H6T8Q2_9AGAR|nr:Glyco-hydro-cc domain-containing protein [Mycena indigotica]KAF7312412.1 Glyco-hydro-cc domain-containing protein [Mycena indigotica]
MKALHVFVALTLLACDALASQHNVARHHSRQTTGLARRANRRNSCKAPVSSKTPTTSTQPPASTPKQSNGNQSNGNQSNGNQSNGNQSNDNKNNGNGNNNNNNDNKSSNPVKSVQAAAGFTPNGKKAGTSSGNALSTLDSHIGWWYDWSPNPSKQGQAMPVPMLWGGGNADGTDASRLAKFKTISQAPQYMLGFEEPDCAAGGGSAGMSVSEGVSKWEQYIAPFKAKGTKLGSPSMCHQAAETWLKQFSKQISTDWDFTNIHVNKNNMAGVRADLDHYASYGKPIWVSEFACVDDSTGFEPCTDQGQINKFISDIVDLFESDGRVAAYAYSNGMGLGNVWPMTTSSGALSASGKAYLAAISKYH